MSHDTLLHKGIWDKVDEGITEQPSLDTLLSEVLRAIKTTPLKYNTYWCHGEPHTSTTYDMDTLTAKLIVVLQTV